MPLGFFFFFLPLMINCQVHLQEPKTTYKANSFDKTTVAFYQEKQVKMKERIRI